MAETLKGVRKALEDLTEAYKRILGLGNKITDFQKIEEIDDKLTSKEPTLKVEDFIIGTPSFARKNITPSSISNIIGSSTTGAPFVINANRLGIFRKSEKYVVSANFIVKSAVSPPFVQIIMKNNTSGALLNQSQEVLSTEKKVELEFVYIGKDEEEILFLFEFGGTLNCEVEWKSITFYKVEAKYTNEQKNIGAGLLEEHVTSKKPFFNVIRNKKGSISVPIAEASDDAVSLGQVDDKISSLRNNISTEKTERMSEDAKRYTKNEVDDKLKRITTNISFEENNEQLKIISKIYSQTHLTGEDHTTLPVYYHINDMIDDIKSRILSLENKSGASQQNAESIVSRWFFKLFQNGYVQWYGMEPPGKVFSSIQGMFYWDCIETIRINGRSHNLWILREKQINPPPGWVS